MLHDFSDSFGAVFGWALVTSLLWLAASPGGSQKVFHPKATRLKLILTISVVAAWFVWSSTESRNQERWEHYENAQASGEKVLKPFDESAFGRGVGACVCLLLFGFLALHAQDRPPQDDETA